MAVGAQVLQVEQLALPQSDASPVSSRARDHDDVLLAAIARSDERAFRELVERHIDRAMSRQQSAAYSAAGHKKVQQMIALLDELHDVITAENRMLSSGLPASLSQTVLRKTELAGGLYACLAQVRAGELEKDGTDPAELAEMSTSTC